MRGYSFCGTAIEVESDLPAVTSWLDEFLTPSFDLWSGARADFAVRIRTAPSPHAALASTRPPGPLAEMPCFALDREVVELPGWTTSERTVLADAKFGALYALGDASVEMVAQPGSQAYRGAAMRVVREIATARALASHERLQLHVAALELGGRALLFAGPKGAGKTTALAYVAAASGAPILTNDRALVARAPGGFEVRGVPTIVSIRPQTLEFFPRLLRGIPAVERPAHLTLEETDAALAAHGNAENGAHLKLSPAQLARQLGVSLSARARLAAIAFPEADGDPHGLAVDPLSGAEAARRLPGVLFGAHSGTAEPTVFERFARVCRPADADRELVEAIAARIPCFALRIGAARYAERGAADAILAACL
jgi:hypothetical protein